MSARGLAPVNRQGALARLAGSLYLLASVAFIAAGTVRGRVLVPGDGVVSAEHIRASADLFRAGMAIDLISGVLFLLTALALFRLLRAVDDAMAGAMVAFVVMGVAVGFVSALAQYATLTVSTGTTYATALGTAGAGALVELFAEIQRGGLAIDQVFSGLWLLPLGHLVYRSGMFPKWVGVLLLIGGASWIALFLIDLLVPDAARSASVLAVGTLGEVVFIFWLLVKGVRSPTAAGALATRPR
jgi:uncharacterized protein DUF4386